MLWDKTRPRAASQKKKIGQWHVMLSHPDFQIGAKFISTNSSSNINRIDMFIGPANEDWNTEGFYWSFIHIIIYDDITPVFFASYTSIGCSPSSSHLTLCVDRFLRFTWCGWKIHYHILIFSIHLCQAIGQGRRTEKRVYVKGGEVQELLVPSSFFPHNLS